MLAYARIKVILTKSRKLNTVNCDTINENVWSKINFQLFRWIFWCLSILLFMNHKEYVHRSVDVINKNTNFSHVQYKKLSLYAKKTGKL